MVLVYLNCAISINNTYTYGILVHFRDPCYLLERIVIESRDFTTFHYIHKFRVKVWCTVYIYDIFRFFGFFLMAYQHLCSFH